MVNLADLTTTAAISRPSDSIVNLFLQPNSVSVGYQTGSGEMIVSCLNAPTILNGTFIVNTTTNLTGHLFADAPGSVVVVSFGSSLTIAGTAVLGGTLVLNGACSQVQNMTVFTSTFVVGSFAAIDLQCSDGCTGTAIPTQTFSSLSVTVTVTCPSLSRGAIVGIALGVVAGGALTAVGIYLATKYAAHQRTVSAKSQQMQDYLADAKAGSKLNML